MFDVIIIGSGLGGLQCAYLLSKIGMNVAVVEQNAVHGGCLQSFFRRGVQFESGFHYVGALAENEALNKLFDYYNLLHFLLCIFQIVSNLFYMIEVYLMTLSFHSLKI